jgi:hypothetical protein
MPKTPAALLLLMPLACARADESTQALQTATEELQAARAAFEADQGGLRQELAELRKSVDATNARLDALAAERRRPVPRPEPTDSSSRGFPLLSGSESVEGPTIPTTEFSPEIAAAVRCESAERCTIDRAFVETLAINPASLAKQARVVPSMRDEVLQGYKFYGIRRGSLPQALGIKNGDLIRSINGYALASIDKVLELYTKLRHESTFVIVIDRRGAPFTLTVEIVGS